MPRVPPDTMGLRGSIRSTAPSRVSVRCPWPGLSPGSPAVAEAPVAAADVEESVVRGARPGERIELQFIQRVERIGDDVTDPEQFPS